MSSGESTSRSSVWLTTPSVEFSTGTTPYSQRLASTSSKISRIAATGQNSAMRPNSCTAAWCVYVPCGPRYATRTPFWMARDAERISRYTLRMALVGKSPEFCRSRRSKISSSRLGTKTDWSLPALREPMSALRCARAPRSSRIRSSIASISSRSFFSWSLVSVTPPRSTATASCAHVAGGVNVEVNVRRHTPGVHPRAGRLYTRRHDVANVDERKTEVNASSSGYRRKGIANGRTSSTVCILGQWRGHGSWG